MAAAEQGTGWGYGHGKVILLGEHAVVYGHRALAGAIDLGVRADQRLADRVTVQVPAWEVHAIGGPIVEAVMAVRRALGLTGGAEIRAEASVPSRAGLGSSAALLTACAWAAA